VTRALLGFEPPVLTFDRAEVIDGVEMPDEPPNAAGLEALLIEARRGRLD
jgi:hypothetical protein